MRQQRGQVMSSFVAVAAAIAVVIGLLVLFGTRDPGDSAAGPPTSPSPSTPPASSGTPTSPTTQTPAPTRPSTVVPTSTPPPKPSTTPTTPTSPTTSPTEKPTDPETTGVSRAPVEIYNNTTRRGLADRVARQARSEGWHVAGVDNWRGKVVGSTVYHPDGMRAAAEALAGDLGIGLVKPALGNMKKDRLTVILTKDYSESNLK